VLFSDNEAVGTHSGFTFDKTTGQLTLPGLVEQYNGATPQKYRLFNTRTDGSNYAYGAVEWTGGQFHIRTYAAGTGAPASIGFYPGGNLFLGAGGFTTQWELTPQGHLLPFNGVNSLDLGSTTKTVRAGYFGTSVVTPVVKSSAGMALDATFVAVRDVNGVSRWQFFADGSFGPQDHNSRDFGSSTSAARSGHFATSVVSPQYSFGAAESSLQYDATNFVALRNGVSPQTLAVYGLFTDAANYQRGEIACSGAQFNVWARNAGTGGVVAASFGTMSNARTYFITNGVTKWLIEPTGELTPYNASNTYDLGSVTATVRNGYFGSVVHANRGGALAQGVAGLVVWGSSLDNNYGGAIQLRSQDGTTANHSLLSTVSGLRFVEGAALRWQMASGGHLVPGVSNAHDVASSATPARSGYFGTLLETLTLNIKGAGSGINIYRRDNGAICGTLYSQAGNLQFFGAGGSDVMTLTAAGDLHLQGHARVGNSTGTGSDWVLHIGKQGALSYYQALVINSGYNADRPSVRISQDSLGAHFVSGIGGALWLGTMAAAGDTGIIGRRSHYFGENAYCEYGMWTDGANYERLAIEYSSGVYQIRTQAAGTGLQRALWFDAALYVWRTGQTERLSLTSTQFSPYTDLGMYLGTSGNRWLEMHAQTINGTTVNGTTVNASALKFPATQVPSADANTLDDYEEGTFTPTLNFGGATTGITYVDQNADYTKVGRAVHFRIYLKISAKGSATGAATISGLPFTPQAAPRYSNVSIYASDMSGITAQLQGFLNGTAVQLTHAGMAGTAANVTDANFANFTALMIAGTYFV
jgi:hypothetical protein